MIEEEKKKRGSRKRKEERRKSKRRNIFSRSLSSCSFSSPSSSFSTSSLILYSEQKDTHTGCEGPEPFRLYIVKRENEIEERRNRAQMDRVRNQPTFS